MQITFYSSEDDRDTVEDFKRLAEKKGKSVSAYLIELMKEQLNTENK